MAEINRHALTALLAKIKGIRKLAVNILQRRLTDNIEVRYLKNIFQLYDEVRNWLIYRNYQIGEHMPYLNTRDIEDYYRVNISTIRPILDNVIIGCDVAISGLEEILKPEISPTTLNRLMSLRKELDVLNIDVDVKKNIEKAISEAEQGHDLASTLISSRVLIYLIQKIPGEKIEEKAKKIANEMVEQKLLPSDRKSIITEARDFIDIAKKARNIVSHNIHYWPGPEDTLNILSKAVKLVKLKRFQGV